MHELSIAQGLVEVASEALERNGSRGVRVLAVRVRIGALSGVVPDALEFCYAASVAGTPLDGSRLVVEDQPAVIHCSRCEADRKLEDGTRFLCPACGAPAARLVQGRELELISLEVVDLEESAHGRASEQRSTEDPGGSPGAPEGQRSSCP